nr:BatD family protein [Shewanella sp. Isolate11]
MTLCLCEPAYALTKLETSVDRNPAIEGEYLVLTIKADDEVDNASLDTRALLKDFIVGRTSVSRSTQIMNFDASKETRWQILLAPKQSGIITIPALTIDKVSSDPITLKVAATGSQPEQMKNLFIRSTVSTEEAYVGQLITYKVKLYLAVELQRGVLSAPQVEGAQLKQLGDDVDTTEILDGRRYRVIERTYSVIADKPGTLSLSGASFSGDVLVDTSRRGGMFSFNQSRPMEAKAAPSEITILPAPEHYQGKWLVSDLVIIKEDQPDTNTVEVGSPITRNITLIASNSDESSLPEIPMSLPDSFKTYPEKPQRQTFVREKQVVAQLTQTTAIVPTKAGTYTLPEIKVPWWNSHSRKQEFATLPERTITVTAAENSNAVTPTLVSEAKQTDSGYWPYLTALFAALWLLTLLLWRKQYREKVTMSPSFAEPVSPKKAPNGDLQTLTAACQTAEAGNIMLALQAYFSQRLNRAMTLTDIGALTPELAQAITQLQQARYSKTHQPIDTKAIINAVKQASITGQSAQKSALSPLNPSV